MLSSKDPHQLTDEVLINAIKQSSRDINLDDCVVELRNRYMPLIKSLVATRYVHGMDFEDWTQEASCVMLKVINTYNCESRVRFGVFYRRCLRNWFNDLVRKRNAKKRIPASQLTSYSANQVYYDDVLRDTRAIHPERALLTTDFLKKLMRFFSHFEKIVALSIIINQQSPATIAKRNHCSVTRVKNAFARCTLKFRAMQNDKLN